MPIPIIDIPPEILQKIALYATLGSALGPPTELYNCLLTCRTFRDVLSPQNARELYFDIFAKRFDARGPIYRLGPSVVREHAALEMRRRFSAIRIFKRRVLDHPELTEALWVAYLMVQDADTSQTNVKQLLFAGLPSFLDLYLRRRLYGGAAENGTWPTLTVKNSLAIALSWTLASQRVMSYEEPGDCQEMMCLLRRIAFASFRYSISNIPEDQFNFGPSFEHPASPIQQDAPTYPIPVPPPQEINYIGSVRRKAHVPSPVLFASLLFLARQDRLTPRAIPSHVTYETREEATQAGYTGLTKADVQHFYDHCSTHFADFPGINVGIQSSAMATSPNVILCQPSSYKLGALSGPWQGSSTRTGRELIESWISGYHLEEKYFKVGMRKPMYLTLEEHYCYNANAVVPSDTSESGVMNAWMPRDLQAIETPHGMKFSDSNAFHTTYETFRPGQTPPLPESKQVVDVIITGKTDDQYAAWGQPNKILGRVRMCDGLVVLVRVRIEDPENAQREVLRGYVTSSKTFVGKVSVANPSDLGIFNLNKNHTGTSRHLFPYLPTVLQLFRTTLELISLLLLLSLDRWQRLKPVTKIDAVAQLERRLMQDQSFFPQEVLEHIAFLTATDTFLGPPSSLLPLLLTSRPINASLSIASNHHLYARIFCHKFDTAAPISRLGSDQLTSLAFAEELRRRCVVLQRLRDRLDSTTHARHADGADNRMSLYDVLFTVYIMMLENDGKNKLQLVEYGLILPWIREFWFNPHGSSLAIYNIRTGQWPLNCAETALGMWLFWFLLKTEDYPSHVNDGVESPLNILKAMALGAHIYHLTSREWVDFDPKSVEGVECTTLYSESMDLTPLPLATPAILSFLALVNKKRLIPLPPSDAPLPKEPFREWDSEWGKCFTKPKRNLGECFRPGSIEGVWEGFFTYTEFTAYAALLGGAPPTIIQKSVVGRHQQTWKLREHHLLSADPSGSDSGIDMDIDHVPPLRAGDPLRAYFPTGTQIREHRDGLTVQDSGTGQMTGRTYRYQRSSILEGRTQDEEPLVKDIIITGEGHSAWGQFNLVGRIRPWDGFISLSKEYVDGDRGKWLYQGFLVGNENGNFAGRWRDTLSPADVPGYEGCFAMSRRR